MEIAVMSYSFMVAMVFISIVLVWLSRSLRSKQEIRTIFAIAALFPIALFCFEFTKIPPGIASNFVSEVDVSGVTPEQLQKGLFVEAKVKIILDEQGKAKSISLVKGSTTLPAPIAK